MYVDMLKSLQDYFGNKVLFAQVEIQWIITSENLNLQWKLSENRTE